MMKPFKYRKLERMESKDGFLSFVQKIGFDKTKTLAGAYFYAIYTAV